MRSVHAALVLSALGGLLLCAAPVRAADDDVSVVQETAAAAEADAQKPKDAQGKRMVAAFKAWAKKWGLENAAFAAMRDDKLIGQARVGDQKATGAEPVASLSKAITAVCVVKLVEAKKLYYSSRLGQLIPDYFKAHKPADPKAKGVTVAQLLTQASGIGYDPTQGTPEFAAMKRTKVDLEGVLALALAKPLTEKVYFYNNVNYDALGLVIQTVTGKPYEKYCKDTVLEPAGVTAAKLNPQWKIMAAFGGWKISAVDYAKFLDHFRPAAKLLKSKPESWPKTDLGGGAFYSIGVAMRASGDSYNFWHSGAWYWPDPLFDFGSYFAMWAQNARFVATYSPQPPDGAVGDLDYAMHLAAFPESGAAPPQAAPQARTATPPVGSDRGP